MAYDNYLAAGVHIGMKQQTKDMKKFVYKIRPDGNAVLNVSLIDERIKTAAKFLSKFQRIMVVSRKGIGQKPVKVFTSVTNTKPNVGRFLPGTITNPAFPGYFEPQAIITVDPQVDKQTVKEAVMMRVPIISLCDTFNETSNIDFVIPCNNKGRKSLGMVLYTLALELKKARGEIKEDAEFPYKPEEWESEEEVYEERRDEGERRPRREGMDRGGQGRGRSRPRR